MQKQARTLAHRPLTARQLRYALAALVAAAAVALLTPVHAAAVQVHLVTGSGAQ